MILETELLALPRKKVLTGGGYVWEYTLANRGWNELSCLDKYGIVVGVFELTMHSMAIVVDVYWPAVNITLRNIFPSELLIGEI
jgi:hypothetical protein